MQYNISINQKAVLANESFSELDLIDLALFDFIYHFMNCDSPKKVTFRCDNKEYTDIRLGLIEQEMPILKFGCRKTFMTRMAKLVSAGLICRYENNATENRSGYCRGENFSKMVFFGEEHEQGEKEKLQGCNFEVTGGVTLELHKHNKENNIDKEERDKSLSKKDQIDYDAIMTAWNKIAASMPKLSSVRNITDDRKQKIRSLFKKTNSNTEELIRLIKTLPYADDWVIGRQKGRDWAITFTWLISNVNGWYATALEGGMHKNNRYMFDKIMSGEVLQEYQSYSKKEDKLIINGVEYQ